MRVLFRVAAGPRLGFGHLMRARSIARALGVTPTVCIRGDRTAVATATARGFQVERGGLGILRANRPRVLVVDDPLEAEAARWVERARATRIPVATLHDLGLGFVESDLAIDGSIEQGDRREPFTLAGPLYAVLDPAVAQMRTQPLGERRAVLLALGGGDHVHQWGEMLARAIRSRRPDATIRIAQGFSREARTSADPRITWVSAPDGLAGELAAAAVAVVGGGVTLYEAAVLATPAVGVAVVSAQQPTIRGFARRGAAVDAGIFSDPAAFAHAADAVADLLEHPVRAARLGATAAHLVDGRGVFRVADAIRQLARRAEDESHAA